MRDGSPNNSDGRYICATYRPMPGKLKWDFRSKDKAIKRQCIRSFTNGSLHTLYLYRSGRCADHKLMEHPRSIILISETAMNPFIESTVARPRVDQRGAKPRKPAAQRIVHKKRRRSFFGSTLRAMGLVTTLGAGAGPGVGLPAAGLGLAALAASSAVHAVNVNTATQAQLETVRGIGPKTAQTIVSERSRGGAYESFQDLTDRVKGIGSKKAAALQAGGLTLQEPAGSGAAVAGPKPAASAPARTPDSTPKPSSTSSNWSGLFKR
jgi:competence protein ComEA